MAWTLSDDQKRKTMTELDSGVLGTVKIDPDKYSEENTNTNMIDRMKYAFAGLLHLVVRHNSIRYIIGATLLTYLVAWWLGASMVAWALLSLGLGQVWLAEIFNTGLEAVTDLTTEGDIRSLAKVAKDVAAAGTFIASGVLLIIYGVTLLPLFLLRF